MSGCAPFSLHLGENSHWYCVSSCCDGDDEDLVISHAQRLRGPQAGGKLGGAEKYGRAQATSLNTAEAQRLLNRIPAYTKYKQRRRRFRRNPVVVLDSHHQFQADMMDMTIVAPKNKHCHWVLVVVDCFSKKAGCQLVKRKESAQVRDALIKVFEEIGIPEKLQTDKGKEFYCKEVSALCKKHEIVHFSTENDEIKATMAERMIRTLRQRIWRLFEARIPSVKYCDALSHIVADYNATVHSAHQLAPNDVSDDNSLLAFNRLYGKLLSGKSTKPVFRVGDKVRINVTKDIYSKGYEPNFKDEICTISKVIRHVPETVYQVREPDGEEIVGCFYRPELAKCE